MTTGSVGAPGAVLTPASDRAIVSIGIGDNQVMGVGDEVATRSAYDVVADAYADHFRSTEPEQPIDLAMIDHFAGLLHQPRRVLDAGCGAARLMPYLAALGCQVQGVDLSEGMIRRAQQDHPEFETTVGSLTRLEYGDTSFDGSSRGTPPSTTLMKISHSSSASYIASCGPAGAYLSPSRPAPVSTKPDRDIET